MGFEAIMEEVDELHSVSIHLQDWQRTTPPVATELVSVAGKRLRSVAIVLAILFGDSADRRGHVAVPLTATRGMPLLGIPASASPWLLFSNG
jgi:hypothetical protein